MRPVRRQRRAQRSSRIPRRGLNPQFLKEALAQNPPVRHAVQRDAAGHAQARQAGEFTSVTRQLQHDLLRHHLDGPRHIRVTRFDRRLRRARRTAEECVELLIRHHEAPQEREVIHVQPERPIRLHVDELLANRADETRLAVGGKTHELVFARVDAEAAVGREGRVKQPEGMREAQLAQHLNRIAAPGADGGCRPFADAIDREDRRLFERRRIKRARRMRQVMLGEKNRALAPQPRQFFANGFAQIQLLPQPRRQHARPGRQSARRDGQIGFQHPRELGDRLVVEDDGIEVRRRQPGVPQAKLNRVLRETLVILAPGEALLLRGGEDAAIPHQRGGGVVIPGRDAEDAAHGRSEEGIHERREHRAAGENDQRAQHEKDDDQGDQPPLLLLPEEEQELFEELPHE